MIVGIISKLLIVIIFFASALYLHRLGHSRKLPLLRQLFSYSLLFAPYNALLSVLSRFKPTKVIDVEEFDQLNTLKHYWPILKKEAELLFEEGYIRAANDKSDICFESFFKKGWKRFYISWFGESFPSAVYSCPKTVAILKKIPSIKAALFARLPPRSHLNLHRVPFAGIVQYQLGLVIPDSNECKAYIDDQSITYKNGEDFILDSFYTQEIINNTDKARLVLICYIERPLKQPFIKINHWITSFLGFITTPSNTEGEFIGIANRYYLAFSKIFRLITKPLKLLKRHYKQVYKLIRTLLLLLFIFLLYSWIGLEALFKLYL